MKHCFCCQLMTHIVFATLLLFCFAILAHSAPFWLCLGHCKRNITGILSIAACFVKSFGVNLWKHSKTILFDKKLCPIWPVWFPEDTPGFFLAILHLILKKAAGSRSYRRKTIFTEHTAWKKRLFRWRELPNDVFPQAALAFACLGISVKAGRGSGLHLFVLYRVNGT